MRHCRICGDVIDKSTKKCRGCGKQYFNAKRSLSIIVLVFLLHISLLFNIALNGRISTKEGRIRNLESEIENAELQIDSLKDELKALENTNATLSDEISAMQSHGTLYDELCYELSWGNIGYAADNFKASESIILIDQCTYDRQFTLTAWWSNGGNVEVNYSSDAA